MNQVMKIGLSADVGQFIAGMGQASAATQAFGAMFGHISGAIHKGAEEIRSGLHKIGIASLGVIASLSGATAAASGYETSLRNVQSITKDTWATTQSMGQSLLDFSRTTTTSAGDLANSLYDVASSGFTGKDALDIVKASATAASAGMSDAKTAGFALSGVLNAYGMTAKDVTGVSDTLFQTVNLGVLTFADLAQGMGEWVSMAASAKVPLADAAAALATITRAGIVPAEASTSLARVMQSFLNPTQDMQTAIKGLGFESGATMLQQIGLKRSVEAVGKVTGGSADKIIKFFGDIRAGRGALALLTNAGENYNAVSQGFTDKTQLAGATAKAFAIQARGLGAQFTMLRNNLKANVIEFGQFMTPLARFGVTGLNKGIAGFFTNLPSPIHGAVVAIGGFTAALAGLIALFGLWKLKSSLLKTITGVSSTTFAGIGWAAKMIGAHGVAGAFSDAAKEGTKFRGSMLLANRAATAIGVPLGTIGVAVGVTAAAVVAGVAGWMAWAGAVKNAKKHAEEFVANLMKVQDTSTPRGVQRAMMEVSDQLKNAKASANEFGSGFGRSMERVVENLSPIKNHLEEAEARIRALRDEQGRLTTMQDQFVHSAGNANAEIIRLNRAAGDSGKTIHLTSDEVAAFAAKLGVDLSKGGAEGQAGLAKIAQAAIDASAAGISMGNNYGEAARQVVAMSAEAGKAARSFAAGVRDQFISDSDIVSKFTGSIIDDFNKFKMVAQRDTAGKLIKNVPKIKVFTEGTFKIEDVKSFYQAAYRENQVFENDLRTAIQKGMDPELIARFMKAGPKESGKLLHTIIDPKVYKGEFKQMLVDYERTLREMASHTAELGRLTALAMNSPKDVLTKDLPTAMKVAETVMFMRGQKMKTTFETVAKSAHLPIKMVEKIATEFGIGLKHTITTFKDLGIARQLSDVLTAQMINVNAPQTLTDQIVKNFISGDQLTLGLTNQMMDAFANAHPDLHLKPHWNFDVEAGTGIFKDKSVAQIVDLLLGKEGISAKALLEIVPDYRKAVELHQMLQGDKTKQVTVNALLNVLTDPTATDEALKLLVFAMGTGQISTKTFGYGLHMIATPEAMMAYNQLVQEQKHPVDHKITVRIDGQNVTVDLTRIDAQVEAEKKKLSRPVQLPVAAKMHGEDRMPPGKPVPPIKVKFTTSIDPTTGVRQVDAVYAELKKQADKHTVGIKVNPDKSISVTRDKLAEVTAKVHNIQKDKMLEIHLVAGGTANKDLKAMEDRLNRIKDTTWTINLKVNDPSLLFPGQTPMPMGPAFGDIFQMEKGGFAKRPIPAHVSKMPTVLYGEGGTGGEAYIPLAKGRRKRSEKILEQVATMFGMKLSKMAVGGIINDERFRQAHLIDVGRQQAQTASFAASVAAAVAGITDAKERAKAAQDAIAAMAKTYADVEYAAGHAAAAQLAASGLTGDAWDAAAQRVIDAANAAKARWTNLWTDLWTKGKISQTAYFGHLQAEMAKVAPYSDEWLSLRDAIVQAQRATQDVAHDTGHMSDDAYIKILRARMASVRLYSDEWGQIWGQITSLQKEAQDKINNQEDHAYSMHQITTAAYIKDLQRRLAATDKWSSDYTSILGQIEQLQQSFKDPILNATNAVQHFGTTAPQGFAEVSSYFTHAIAAAKRFNADIAALKKMGLDNTLLSQLVQAGPSAVPFMDAILRGGASAVKQTNASQAELTRLAGQTFGAFSTGTVPGQPIRGAGSTMNNSQNVTLSIGNISVAPGATKTEVDYVVQQAFKVFADELQKRNN